MVLYNNVNRQRKLHHILILLLLFVTALMMFNIEANKSIRSTIVNHLRSFRPSTEAQFAGDLNAIFKNRRNITHHNCSIIDFLASVDESARRMYDPDLLCDDFAPNSDIVCRMYLKQIGLQHLERTTCVLENPKKVPRVVYFVIFGEFQFKFTYYVTAKAAKNLINATAVYVIGDQHPIGKWWQQLLKDTHGVRFLYREQPANIFGIKPTAMTHVADVVRLQILYINGGIYLDADMLVLRDLDPLLDYDITLGLLDNATGMGNAFIMAKRESPFVHEWYNEYTRYKRDKYYWNSLQFPRKMWLDNPKRVHMESVRLYRPNWFEAELLFNRTDYPWRNNYAVHVWQKASGVPQSLEDIENATTTVAQIFRYVLYGDFRPRNIPR